MNDFAFDTYKQQKFQKTVNTENASSVGYSILFQKLNFGFVEFVDIVVTS